MTTQAPTTDDERNGKEIYDRVIAFVKHNTGGYQPPVTRQETVVSAVAYGTYKGDWVRDAITTAMMDYEIVRINDEGQQYLAVGDIHDLSDRLESYRERRDEPNQRLVDLANMLIYKMEGTGDYE